MHKDYYVIFTPTTAIIKKGVVIEESPLILKNPKLGYVQGVPPHFWKLTEDRKIIPMTIGEKEERQKLLNEPANHEVIILEKEVEVVKTETLIKIDYKLIILASIISAVVGVILGALVK